MNVNNINIWKDETKKVSKEDALYSRDLAELELGTRAYNGLKRARCNTVGDVINIIGVNGENIGAVKNIGEKSKKEILEKIAMLSERIPETAGASTGSSLDKRVLLRIEGKAWNTDIAFLPIRTDVKDRLIGNGIRKVKDLYSSSVSSDINWLDVRELFEQLIKLAR